MSWINIVECLQCSNRYEEKNKDFVEVCPYCGNDDVLETIYVTEEEEEA